MSIASMANVAFVRRRDVSTKSIKEDEAPVTSAEIEEATAGTAESQTPATTAMKVIATYIPTEILTLYVAVLGALQPGSTVTSSPSAPGTTLLISESSSEKSLWIAFVFFFVLTPVIVWLTYAAKVRAAKKSLPILPRTWPVWEMFAATVAYSAWAFALPDNPFKLYFAWYSPALSGVIVLAISTVLGLLAPVVQRPLST